MGNIAPVDQFTILRIGFNLALFITSASMLVALLNSGTSFKTFLSYLILFVVGVLVRLIQVRVIDLTSIQNEAGLFGTAIILAIFVVSIFIRATRLEKYVPHLLFVVFGYSLTAGVVDILLHSSWFSKIF